MGMKPLFPEWFDGHPEGLRLIAIGLAIFGLLSKLKDTSRTAGSYPTLMNVSARLLQQVWHNLTPQSTFACPWIQKSTRCLPSAFQKNPMIPLSASQRYATQFGPDNGQTFFLNFNCELQSTKTPTIIDRNGRSPEKLSTPLAAFLNLFWHLP